MCDSRGIPGKLTIHRCVVKHARHLVQSSEGTYAYSLTLVSSLRALHNNKRLSCEGRRHAIVTKLRSHTIC